MIFNLVQIPPAFEGRATGKYGIPAPSSEGVESSPQPTQSVASVLERFVAWLESFGPSSRDHQSFYAGPIGGGAKALYYRHRLPGTLAVSPMVLAEALFPAARRLFHVPMRFPIADAHYAMGFAFLSEAGNSEAHCARAVRFLEALEASRCPGYEEYCWGYPFDWVTRNGTIPRGTPLITTTPYVYEAFLEVYRLDGRERRRVVLDSIVRHALKDIKDFPVSERASTCSYTPFDTGGVVNAAAYRAAMLVSASLELDREEAAGPAERNLRFVLESQQPDGSWFYAMDGARNFVDHFHTCFVLKALAKIERMTGDPACREAIDRGLEYYRRNLLDDEGLPKPFAKAPRLTVYRRELYDYAECVNLCLLTRKSHPEMNLVLNRVLEDLLARWIKPDGSFRSRELLFGWDNVPMHRWAQSQMFRSLALFVRGVGSQESGVRSQEPGGR
jgi:hypothetical protein